MSDTDKIKAIISEHLGVAVADVTPEKKLEEDFHADSLDMVELVLAFEQEFNLTDVPDDAHERVKTVEDVIKFVEFAARADA